MASSKGRSLNKMPLNAEITRLSAGRVSRSAQYGVTIKDIGKSFPNNDMPSHQPEAQQPERIAPPGYYDTSRHEESLPAVHQSLPAGSLQVGQPRLAPPNSKAVFQAPEEDFTVPYSTGAPRITVGTSRSIVLNPQYLSQGNLY